MKQPILLETLMKMAMFSYVSKICFAFLAYACNNYQLVVDESFSLRGSPEPAHVVVSSMLDQHGQLCHFDQIEILFISHLFMLLFIFVAQQHRLEDNKTSHYTRWKALN